jgi:hypothetical protein
MKKLNMFGRRLRLWLGVGASAAAFVFHVGRLLGIKWGG